MLNVNEFVSLLEKFAPLSLSYECISKGDYDNSGLLIKCNDKVEKVLFSLDLSRESLLKAKKNKCDTIVTHHPAIYAPIKNLAYDDMVNSAVLEATKNNINVISMHLNLDIATDGIDECLAKGLGAKSSTVLSMVNDVCGYGRLSKIEPTTFADFIKNAKSVFKTERVTYYGNKKATINTVASFCGAGAGQAEKIYKEKRCNADLIVTSDMPHHVLKELTDLGYNIMLLTHYASEIFGFEKFYQKVKELAGDRVSVEFFDDKKLR